MDHALQRDARGPDARPMLERTQRTGSGTPALVAAAAWATTFAVATPAHAQGAATSSVSAPAAPPPPAAPLLPFPVRVYGFVKAGVIASEPGESYAQPNSSAMTAARHPLLRTAGAEPELTFQVAQSRVGVQVNDGGVVRAKLEVDFIDFTKASPTLAALPRLRIAQIEWSPAPGHVIEAGQDWDMIAPLNPFGPNFVGGLFQSGNLGFMRHQLQYRYEADGWQLGGAIGMAGNNNTPAAGNLEQGFRPTFAARAAYSPSKGTRFGLAGMISELKVGADERRLMFTGVAHLELAPWTGMSIRGEAYVAQNAAPTGLLTLSAPRAGVDQREVGGWLSAKQCFGGLHAVWASFGGAGILNPEDTAAGYTVAADGKITRAGLGVRRNLGARVGYELKPHPQLALMLEGSWQATRHTLLDGAGVDPDVAALGGELAMVLSF